VTMRARALYTSCTSVYHISHARTHNNGHTQALKAVVMSHINGTHNQGWPEPYIFTVYDRFDDFPAKNTVYTPYIHMVLANPTHNPRPL
jgi:hypothetical protein